MSMAKCDSCGKLVDCDADPDATDFPFYENKIICESCREAIDDFNTGGDMYKSDYAEHHTWHKGNL